MKTLLKKFTFHFLMAFVFSMLLSTVVMAADPANPASPDVASLLLQILSSWKTATPIALAMLGVNLVVGVLKSDVFSNFFKNLNPLMKGLILTVLGQVAGILNMIVSGKSVQEAIVFGLFTSGGAVAIYEAYNLFKKQAAVK